VTEEERHLLKALAIMCDQYLGDGDGAPMDHQCMRPGERAVELLIQYGLVEPRGRGGTWTEAGIALMNSA
jgi:hypothetical protein